MADFWAQERATRQFHYERFLDRQPPLTAAAPYKYHEQEAPVNTQDKATSAQVAELGKVFLEKHVPREHWPAAVRELTDIIATALRAGGNMAAEEIQKVLA